MANPLRTYRILIADADYELAKVLRNMLMEMGFGTVEVTRSGQDAYWKLKDEPFDFLITEWNTQAIDGITLLKKIRRSPDSPNPTLPIIMLTGRAEQPDVFTARDLGINEFVVKPFTAKAIYNRIERIIENPKPFVVSPSFVGPERRARGTPPPGMADRRVASVKPQLQPRDVHKAIASDAPKVWLPDFSLKYKIGKQIRLDSIITDSVLSNAQAAIDAIGDESMGWIRSDLMELKRLTQAMVAGEPAEGLILEMTDTALSVNSRAGTFGYGRASEVAYMLYLFCRKRLNPLNKEHHLIVQKHLDVLQVILGNQMRGDAGAVGEQIVAELRKLAGKFTG